MVQEDRTLGFSGFLSDYSNLVRTPRDDEILVNLALLRPFSRYQVRTIEPAEAWVPNDVGSANIGAMREDMRLLTNALTDFLRRMLNKYSPQKSTSSASTSRESGCVRLALANIRPFDKPAENVSSQLVGTIFELDSTPLSIDMTSINLEVELVDCTSRERIAALVIGRFGDRVVTAAKWKKKWKKKLPALERIFRHLYRDVRQSVRSAFTSYGATDE